MQGQEGAIFDHLNRNAVGQAVLHQGDVLIFAGGVHHNEDMIATVGKHQIVQNAALIVGEEPVALTVFFQACHIHRDQRLKRQGRLFVGRPAQDHLPHVRDVKQAGLAAGVQVFLHHTGGVLHRHLIARERHHLAAQFTMQCIQGEGFQFGHVASQLSLNRVGIWSSPSGIIQTQRSRATDAPSVTVPEIVIPSADAFSRLSPE